MADRLSLKWIEGNTNATTPVVSADATFNVDNPAFWTPLSVLSGLASGYCERRAVLNSTFATGAATTLVWSQGGTAAAEVAARDTIVNNCMHNMALGSDYAHLFYTADATMHPIGPATGSNYMTTMDSAIVKLIDASETNRFVPATGATAYADFSDLATSAKATANAAGSAIQTPVQGGGSYKVACGPGLPVEWAKERKWMLDELSWTPTQGEPEHEYATDAIGNMAHFSSAQAAGYEKVTAQSAYDSIKDLPDWQIDTQNPTIYRGSDAGVATTDWRTGFDFMAVPMSLTLWTSAYDNSIPVDKPYPEQAGLVAYMWATSNNQTNYTMNIVANGATVFVNTLHPVQQTTKAEVFLEQGTPIAAQGVFDPESNIINGVATAENGQAFYKVVSGGTLSVPDGVIVSNVIVHSDGIIDIANGGYVDCCTILTGGTWTGIPNIRNLNIDGMFVDPVGDDGESSVDGTTVTAWIQSPASPDAVFTEISGGTPVIIGPDTTIANSNTVYYVKDAGVLLVSAAGFVDSSYTLGQGLADETDVKRCRGIIVANGGHVIVKGMPVYNGITISGIVEDDPYGSYVRDGLDDIYQAGDNRYYCWKLSDTEQTGMPDKIYTDLCASDIEIFGQTEYFCDLPIYDSELTPIAGFTVYSFDHDNINDPSRVFVDCPIVVLSGGTFEQGAGAVIGKSNYYEYLFGRFTAYPGSTVSLTVWEKSGGGHDGICYDGFGYTTYPFIISNEVYFSVHRISLDNPSITSESAYDIYYMAQCKLTGLAYIHITASTTSDTGTWSFTDITGGAFTDYSDTDDPFFINGGTVHSKQEYDEATWPVEIEGITYMKHHCPIYRDTAFNKTQIYTFNLNGLAPFGDVAEPLSVGKNTLDMNIGAIICAKEYVVDDTSIITYATYEKTDSIGVWGCTQTLTHPDAWPNRTLYTKNAIPDSGDLLYRAASHDAGTLDGSTVSSLLYPILTGSTVNVADIPDRGYNVLYGYFTGTDILYRVAITDIFLETEGSLEPTDHYQSFYVRQKALPGDPGYVPPNP